jgi:hypothetical protein
MALRGTLTHWKTTTLADDLGISSAYTLGLLEALWHVTAQDAPAGNIGRLPNRAIVMQMHANEFDPDRLIAALCKSGHLDSDPVHRLVVHDWDKHADHNTKRKVERRGEKMCSTLRQSGGSDASSLTNDAHQPVMTLHDPPMVNDKSMPVPVPVPVSAPVPGPVPAPAPKNSSRAKRVKGEPDSRHAEFRKAIEDYWHSKNSDIEIPWDGSEGSALSKLLKANPNLNAEKVVVLLQNRSCSNVNHSERPSRWLRNVTDYAAGPLDRFNKPLGSDGGGKREPQNLSGIDYREGTGLGPGEYVERI